MLSWNLHHREMKIAYCIAGTCHSGGMERVLALKANWLAAHGHEVVIVTTDQRGEQPFFPLDPRIRCIDLGINYEANNGKSFANKLIHYPGKQRRHRRRLTQLLAEERPDVTVSMFCNDVSFIAEIPFGGRKVLEIHFSKFKRLQYGRKGLWRLADRWQTRQDEKRVKRFHRFVVLTEQDRQFWGNLPNIAVIPNPNSYEPTALAPLTSHRAIAVGRYTHQKGFDRLIEAWQVIAAKAPDWKLSIIGDGVDRAKLQRMIAERGLTGCVVLRQPTKAIDKEYLGASLLLMTSRYEGFPLALAEAQSFGVPAVSVDCKCGPREIIRDGVTGFVVAEGNTEAFAEHALQLMTDDALRHRMGEAAAVAARRFTIDAIMAQWLSVFLA